LTTGVLFLAVACYIGVYLYNALINTYVTTPAVSFSIEETLPAQGYIVRTEAVIAEDGIAVLPIVGEGEKVAAGQAIAIEYMNLRALELASEIRDIRMKLAQMESFGGISDSASFETVLGLSTLVHSRDLSRLDELLLDVEAYIFTDDSEIEVDLPTLQNRLAELERRSQGTRVINAQASGTFSHVVDGFEHIGPDVVRNISPTDLSAHFKTPYGISGTGKLVTEFKWYYAAIMEQEDAARLTAGRRIAVQFYGAYHAEVDMLVESIGRRESGQCVVLFSSDRGIHDVAPLRSMRADIVFSIVTGIRVPKEAIHLDDDTTFIYLQTGVRAERVDVEILRVTGDSYLVRDGIETGSPLRVDSIIIVRANNLYHGKVVA
jgi:multidrug efflux pump subunit AcrA (membrane-fusion protein)